MGRGLRLARRRARGALAYLAVAPLPKSFIGYDMVELTAMDGMPDMGSYSLAMIVAPDATAPVRAAADHIRAAFEVFRETGKFR